MIRGMNTLLLMSIGVPGCSLPEFPDSCPMTGQNLTDISQPDNVRMTVTINMTNSAFFIGRCIFRFLETLIILFTLCHELPRNEPCDTIV